MGAGDPVDCPEGGRGVGLVALGRDQVAVGMLQPAGIEEHVGCVAGRPDHVDRHRGVELLAQHGVPVGQVGVLGDEELETERVVQVRPLVLADPALQVQAAKVTGSRVLPTDGVDENQPLAPLQRSVEPGVGGEAG